LHWNGEKKLKRKKRGLFLSTRGRRRGASRRREGKEEHPASPFSLLPYCEFDRKRLKERGKEKKSPSCEEKEEKKKKKRKKEERQA